MEILSIPIKKLQKKTLLQEVMEGKTQKIVFTPNAEMLVHSTRNKLLRENLKKATHLPIDGVGVLAGMYLKQYSRRLTRICLFPICGVYIIFFRKKLEQKFGNIISGRQLTKDILHIASKAKIPIVIIDRYEAYYKKKIHSQKTFSLKLAKAYPYLDFEYIIYEPKKVKKIIEDIKKSKAKILFSTLGVGEQEQSVIEIMRKTKNIRLGLGVGSSFDVIVGMQKENPVLIEKIGFQWLWRIFTSGNPWRQCKKIWNAVFVFLWMIIRDK